ncbi:hypothetical protein V6N11_067738 [Hibiscus sabdariffa]|uniref:Uncharacterized protein n=1 Tax=Hibiscus sabdariffa TaxID=183260 RepID=A0ABR2SS11_9ROSI
MVGEYDVAAMDANREDGKHGVKGNGVSVGEKIDGVVRNTITYARVTAKSTRDVSTHKPKAATIDEEVVILDEGVIMNRDEKIPSIQFSNPVHDQVDRNMRNAIIVRLLVRAIDFKTLWNKTHSDRVVCDGHLDKINAQEEMSEDKLFGSWMMVENSRRRTFAKGRYSAYTVNAINAAYLASKPDKRNKRTNGESLMMKVELSMGERRQVLWKGDCRTIKTALRTTGCSLKWRKMFEVLLLDTRGVSEFIADLTDHLDSFHDPNTQHHSLSLLAKDRDDVGLVGSKEASSDSDSRYNDDIDITDHDEDVVLAE